MKEDIVMIEQISFHLDMNNYYIFRSQEDIDRICAQKDEYPFFLAVCFFYPKGKRPALPYPQNPSKIESNGNRR